MPADQRSGPPSTPQRLSLDGLAPYAKRSTKQRPAPLACSPERNGGAVSFACSLDRWSGPLRFWRAPLSRRLFVPGNAEHQLGLHSKHGPPAVLVDFRHPRTASKHSPPHRIRKFPYAGLRIFPGSLTSLSPAHTNAARDARFHVRPTEGLRRPAGCRRIPKRSCVLSAKISPRQSTC